jgi:F-type H+-transporting ATPase subunit epsilon
MAADKTFDCSLVTPERKVFDKKATFVAIPAHDGEIGIMHNRAPLMCKLGIGLLRLEVDGKEERYFIDGGFAQVVKNKVTILTEQARSADEVDRSEVEKALAAARKESPKTSAGWDDRGREIERAKTQLKLLNK